MSFGCGLVDRGVVLRGEEDPLVLAERVLEGAGRGGPSDYERHHHVREDDDVPERDDRQSLVKFHEPLGALAGFFDQRNRLFLVRHDLAGDDALADLLLAGQRYIRSSIEILDDHPQAARADLARQRQLRDRLERVVRELELHVLALEQLLVLDA